MPEFVRWFSAIWNHPSNKDGRWESIGRAVAWQIYKRAIRRPWDLTVFGDMRLRCYPNSIWAGLMIYYRERPEYHEMSFVRRYLRPGDCFVDVGANIGVYSLLAASVVGDKGCVHAFEPSPTAAARLRENVSLNRLANVEVHKVAVGALEGQIQFATGTDVTDHVAPTSELDEGGSEPGVIHVESTRLDTALAGVKVALVKIDIEGAELDAFRGAEALLRSRNPAVWQFELKDHLLRRYGVVPHEVGGYLASFGYDLAYWNADTSTLVFDDHAWRARGDVLAIARDHRHRIVQRLRGES